MLSLWTSRLRKSTGGNRRVSTARVVVTMAGAGAAGLGSRGGRAAFGSTAGAFLSR
jgi:hypothetical protein